MLKRVAIYLNERLLLNALANGDYARADKALARIARWEGRSRRVLHNLALVRLGQWNFAAAEALLEQQIEEYGEAPELLRALAEAAYLSGERERAAQRLAAVLADPDCDDRGLLERRAAICADVAAYDRAMAGKQDFAAGIALLRKDDADGAAAAFRRAAEADPTDFVALNNLGTVLLNRIRDHAGAIRAFERAQELSDQAIVRGNLAKAREGMTK